MAIQATNIILGNGVFYFNWGEPSEAIIGVSDGGGTFTVEREYKDIEFDGTYGSVKGMMRKINIVPTLNMNILEINSGNLEKFFGLTTSAETGYTEVTEGVAISATHYLTNVAFVGKRHDGNNIAVILYNALGNGNIEMAFENKEEVTMSVQYTGTYDPTDLEAVPYEIRFYAEDTTAPTVTTTPLNNAVGVAVDVVLTALFSENVVINSTNLTLLNATTGAIIAGAFSYDSALLTAYFTPTVDLSAATSYVWVLSGVKDLVGNTMANTTVFFTTA